MNPDIAVIGCGRWGRNLVRNFAELGALRVVCDANPLQLQSLADKYPQVRCETDFSGVLSDEGVRGVVVATPAATHYDVAKAALEAGKDVFVEKPLALRVEEGEELVRIAEERGRILMVGHVLHYHPAVMKLKQLVHEGALGNIHYIYSNRLNLGQFRQEENILWSFAPHDISVLLWLMGEMPESVSAHGGSYLQPQIADVTVTTFNFAGGVQAHIFVSWLHPHKEQKLVVVGNRRMAVFDDLRKEGKLSLQDYAIEWVGRVPSPSSNGHKAVEIESDEPLKLECQHFLECIERRQTPRTDGRNGLAVLRVLEACQRSLEQGGNNIPLKKVEEPFFVHETALIDAPCRIGKASKIWHFCHVMPNVTIGEDCVLGQNVFVARGVRIGNRVKIQNNVSVYEGVTLEDDVFCGPSCVFTNVLNPRSEVSRRDEFMPTLVKRGATIGANATIICGVTVGAYAFVGAGSVVTHDVPDHALVYGNPARIQGWMCRCGVKLDLEHNGQGPCQGCGSVGRPDTVKHGEVVKSAQGV